MREDILNRIKAVVAKCKLFDRTFVVQEIYGCDYACTVHVEYDEPDVNTGKIERQKSRQWIITLEMNEGDIVETVFACAMRSYDHVVQENFTYEDKRVFTPHVALRDRVALAIIAKGTI